MPDKLSNYKGSTATAEIVKKQIAERWGKEEAEHYDPFTNALTFKRWSELGYKILKGEKSLRSKTFVEKKDQEGNTLKKYPKTVHLFYIKQVIKSEE